MEKQFRDLKAEKDGCSGVLFLGSGDRAFCAGGDVLHIAKSALEGTDWNRRWFSSEFILNYLVSTFEKPVISIWRGIVMGGGVGLSIYGSHRIATETTMFAMPETSIGFFPDVGASYFLSHYVKQPGLGLYLGMTGRRLLGPEAVEAGLATHFVSNDRIESLLDELNGNRSDFDSIIQEFASAPSAGSLGKDLLESVAEYFAESSSFGEFWTRLSAGVDQKDPFAVETMKTLRSKCPLTVRVWYESFRLGQKQSLVDVLDREYHMCIRATEVDPHNFREGVRAQLIEKGKGTPPAYRPVTIEEVTDAMMAEVIESRVGGDLKSCLIHNRSMF